MKLSCTGAGLEDSFDFTATHLEGTFHGETFPGYRVHDLLDSAMAASSQIAYNLQQSSFDVRGRSKCEVHVGWHAGRQQAMDERHV